MGTTVVLKFRAKRYSRKSEKAISVAYGDWDPMVAGWIWPAMEQYERDTTLSPPYLTTWDHLGHALPGLARVPRWKAFATIPIQKLEMEDVRDLFMDIDDAFHRIWGADRGALRSSRVRRFISDYLLRLRPDGMLLRVKGSFRPKGRANHQPRALISDQIGYEGGVATHAPIGAQPHTNPAELKAKNKARLKRDLQLIEDACCRELDAYYEACKVIDAILASPIDVAVERRAFDKLRSRNSRVSEQVALLTGKERAALTAHYLRADSARTATFEQPTYVGSSGLAADLCRRMGIDQDQFLRCARYRYYPHQEVLVAAIVLIQISTAWNVTSVMELPANAIKPLGGGQYLLQSTKTRTGDDTPMVVLEGDDNPGVKALRFAQDRLAAIKARGWADSKEQTLWLSPRSNYDSSRGQPISNLSGGLKKLRKKHSLPDFTFEQLRTLKLTVTSLESGPIAAAELAGHSNFAVIGGYIDHALTRRLNSSINLEFQKRWEAEVAAVIERKPPRHPLMPIGDGTSCLDPAAPPDDSWLKGGLCDASGCHRGSGCANRVLVINRTRVQEAVLTRRYYDANWQRLHAANPEAFAEIHMPRLEFNLYLVEYLKKGPYRHLLHG